MIKRPEHRSVSFPGTGGKILTLAFLKLVLLKSNFAVHPSVFASCFFLPSFILYMECSMASEMF